MKKVTLRIVLNYLIIYIIWFVAYLDYNPLHWNLCLEIPGRLGLLSVIAVNIIYYRSFEIEISKKQINADFSADEKFIEFVKSNNHTQLIEYKNYLVITSQNVSYD